MSALLVEIGTAMSMTAPQAVVFARHDAHMGHTYHQTGRRMRSHPEAGERWHLKRSDSVSKVARSGSKQASKPAWVFGSRRTGTNGSRGSLVVPGVLRWAGPLVLVVRHDVSVEGEDLGTGSGMRRKMSRSAATWGLRRSL